MKTDIRNYDLSVKYAYHLYKAGMHQESYIHNVDLAVFASQVGDLDLAENCYQRAIHDADVLRNYEDKSNALFQLANKVYVEWGRFEEAIRYFDDVLNINPAQVNVLLKKGLVLSRMGRHIDAINSLNKLIDIDRNNPDAWYERARLNLRNGNRQEAVVDLKKAIEIGKEDYRRKATTEEELKILLRDVSFAGPSYSPQKQSAHFIPKEESAKSLEKEITGFPLSELVEYLAEEKVTPIIGPAPSDMWLPTSRILANQWAAMYDYPSNDLASKDQDNLAKVSQYLAIREGNMFPKQILISELMKIEQPNFDLPEYENSPYAILAELPLSIYITTNYDYFLEKALRDKRRVPVSEFCRWNKETATIPSVFDRNGHRYEPSIEHPLVYHLFGNQDEIRSIVLTERDYTDFIANLIRDEQLLPAAIREALAITSLLFLGYDVNDITFRALFQGVIGQINPRYQLPRIVQQPMILQQHPMLPGEMNTEKEQEAHKYIEEYMNKEFNMTLYWSSIDQFGRDLRNGWNEFERLELR